MSDTTGHLNQLEAWRNEAWVKAQNTLLLPRLVKILESHPEIKEVCFWNDDLWFTTVDGTNYRRSSLSSAAISCNFESISSGETPEFYRDIAGFFNILNDMVSCFNCWPYLKLSDDQPFGPITATYCLEESK